MALLHFAAARCLSTVFCFLFAWVYLISEETWLPISGHHLISMFNLSFPIHDSFFLSLRAFVFWFGFHGVMHLAASIFWIRKMWMWWIHSTRKRVLHWRILSLLRCTWLIVISLFISFFNLYHTLIYAPYATALFSNLALFWLLLVTIICMLVDVVSGSEFVVATDILRFVC